jgi:hypothetical protein
MARCMFRYIERFRSSQPLSREQRQALSDSSIRSGDTRRQKDDASDTKTSLMPESLEVPAKKNGPPSHASSKRSAAKTVIFFIISS